MLCVCCVLSHVQLFATMNCSPPGSPVHEILQARIPEWVAISFSGGSSPPRNRTWGLWHCEKWKWKSFSRVWLFAAPWTIGVGNLSLLQGIFPTQGSNPGLPYCRRILYKLSHKGSPRILEWVAYPFSRGSSQPGINLGSPASQVDSLPTESYEGSLHCRQILYCLSHQESSYWWCDYLFVYKLYLHEPNVTILRKSL